MNDVICAGCAHTVGVHYPDTDIRGCSFKDAIGRTCPCPGFVKKPTGRHPNLDPPPTEDGTVSLDEVGVGSEVRYRGRRHIITGIWEGLWSMVPVGEVSGGFSIGRNHFRDAGGEVVRAVPPMSDGTCGQEVQA